MIAKILGKNTKWIYFVFGEMFVYHIGPSSREGCSYKLGQAFEESSHFGHERVRVDLSRGRFVNNCYLRCL